MAILASDIIGYARTTSDLKLSRFLLDDPDLLGFLNDLLSELYDMFVIEREGYFQSSATLSFTNNVATLPADFYKEVSVWSGTTASPLPVPMLDSYADRFTDCGLWISARNIQYYPGSKSPPSPITIDYVPTCPVLAIGTAVPVEFEKFVEWLKVGLTIKIIDARKQPVSATISATFKRLTDRVIKMATARKASPKIPGLPHQRHSFENSRLGYGNNFAGQGASGPLVPGSQSVTLGMMAPGTPGGVLIYDANGNPIILSDVAAGNVLTSNGVGLPPSYQPAGSGGLSQLTGDVTAGPGTGSQAATLARIPAATPALGGINYTKIAAPTAPSGKIAVYADSTTGNLTSVDQFGIVAVNVIPKAAVATKFLSSLFSNGTLGQTQPDFTDLSGSIALAQVSNSLITYAKLQNVSATARLLGRKTAGAGVVEELSASDAATLGLGCVTLDTQNLAAQGTLTTASWTANAWSRIEIELAGISNAGSPANSDIRWRANADSSTKYGSSVQSWTASPIVSQDVVGTATSVQVAYLNTTHAQFICGLIRIFPKTASGRLRSGSAEFTTIPNSATNSEYFVTRCGFVWADSATDMTFATILFGSAATFTGTMIVRGYL